MATPTGFMTRRQLLAAGLGGGLAAMGVPARCFGRTRVGRPRALVFARQELYFEDLDIELRGKVLSRSEPISAAVRSISYLRDVGSGGKHAGAPAPVGLRETPRGSRVGGVAFDQVAKPGPGLEGARLALEYAPNNPPGKELVVTVGGQERELTSYVKGLPLHPWEWVPIARFANTPNYALVTLFGKLEGEVEVRFLLPGNTRFIANYALPFVNTLLGTRLLQADLLMTGLGAEGRVPSFGRGGPPVLNEGEWSPDGPEAWGPVARGFRASLEAHDYESYLICDLGRAVVYSQGENGSIELSGRPFWFFWRPGRGGRVEPLWELSRAVSDHPDLWKLNPNVYRSLLRAMQLSAFFRACKEMDREGWQRFVASLPWTGLSNDTDTPVIVTTNVNS